LILPEVFDFCRLRKQKDYIAVKMRKHGKELAIADKQTIISVIEGGMRARKVAEILDRSESTVSRFLKRYQETGDQLNLATTITLTPNPVLWWSSSVEPRRET